MTFFASLVLVFVLMIRPQEIWPALEALHLLEVFTALAVLGLVVDIGLGRQKNLYSPQLPFLALFLVTAYLVTALCLGSGRAIELGNKVPAIFMLAVMYGASTVSRLRAMIWLIIFLGAFVSVVAVHQGMTPATCIQKTADESGELQPDPDTADGRACGLPSDCRREGEFDVEWVCEHIGMFSTMSIAGRVRWRGQLNDPNELSVFIGAVLPLLFAVGLPFRNAASKRGPPAQQVLSALAFVMIGLGLFTVILSQSRGGQLVIATVFAFLFVQRFGWKGLAIAAIFALPVLLLGGRSDEAADESASDRAELLTEGVSLIIAHPLRGVGLAQFSDQVNSWLHLSAHNSYLLAAAETGMFGFLFWSGLLWMSLKIPITALRTPSLPDEIRAMARALLASFTGIAVGIFFLSFTYKQLLFVWFGLAGAFYGVMRQADPELKMKVGWRDWVGVALADVGIIALLWVYTRTRGGS